jgi:hypothetical protein
VTARKAGLSERLAGSGSALGKAFKDLFAVPLQAGSTFSWRKALLHFFPLFFCSAETLTHVNAVKATGR